MHQSNKSNLQSELIDFSQRVFSNEDSQACELVELQGCTVHRSPIRTVFVYLSCIGIGTIATMKWPLVGFSLFLLCIWGTYRETKGLRGFLGEFLTREVGMNLIFWRSSRLPESDEWSPPTKKRLVLLFPRSSHHTLNPLLLWVLVLSIGIFVLLSWMNISTLWPALSCASIGILGLLLTGERPPPPLNPALEDPLRAALSAPLSEHVELVVGVIDQGIFSCALTTFLKSYERYLPKEHTAIVLCDQAQSTSAVNFGAQWSSNPSFQEMFPIASSFNVQPIQSHLIQSQNSAESLGWNTALIAADWTNTSVVTDLIQNIPTTPLPAAPSLDFSDASEETKTEQDAIEQ